MFMERPSQPVVWPPNICHMPWIKSAGNLDEMPGWPQVDRTFELLLSGVGIIAELHRMWHEMEKGVECDVCLDGFHGQDTRTRTHITLPYTYI